MSIAGAYVRVLLIVAILAFLADSDVLRQVVRIGAAYALGIATATRWPDRFKWVSR